MQFYEKLQKLRKENGMNQEEFAGRLGVSRQAVSKWENGQGYPETDKLLQMSAMFGVSLDYLLKEENEATVEDAAAEPGYYASREMVDSFLYSRQQGTRRITFGVAMCILAVACVLALEAEVLGIVLMFLFAGVGVTAFVTSAFRPKHYAPEMDTQPLLFDPAFLKEFRGKYQGIRRRLGWLIGTGIFVCIISVAVAMLVGYLSESLMMTDRMLALFPVIACAGVSMIVYGVSCLNSYGIIANNSEHIKEVREEAEDDKYGWIFGLLMPFAAMIFLAIGFLTDMWHPGWLVFPVAAILGSGITSFLKSRNK